jgi:hypothetical protein
MAERPACYGLLIELASSAGSNCSLSKADGVNMKKGFE